MTTRPLSSLLTFVTNPGRRQRGLRLLFVAGVVAVAVVVLWQAGVLFRSTTETIEVANERGQTQTLEIRAADVVETPNPLGLDVGLEEGDLAPNFEASNFDGERVQLADFRGHPVFLNFWASWCGPCRAEMPDIQAMLNKYQAQGLVVFAVNNGESYRPAFNFIEELGVQFTEFGLDPGQDVIRLYNVLAMPTSFFIDADGVITDVVLGQIPPEQMEAFVLGAIAGERVD